MYVHTMFNMHAVRVYTMTAICRCNHDYCLLQHINLKRVCLCVCVAVHNHELDPGEI